MSKPTRPVATAPAPPPVTPEGIEVEAADSLLHARAQLREALSMLGAEVARELRSLDAGRTIEPRIADDASRVEVRAARVRERETALALIRQLRAAAAAR
jgi:hypothetical protein